jgi:plastocyanin
LEGVAALITAIVGVLTFYFAVYLPYISAQDKPTDTTPPVIRVPSEITEKATSPDGAAVPFEEVSAEDGVDGAVDVSCDHNSGETFPIGDTVVTCAAEDSAGNSAEKRFTITVQDTPSPVYNATSVSIVPSSSILTTDAFSPNPIQVSVGTTVTWTNDDAQPHTVNSGENATPSGLFDSPIMAPQATFRFTFTEAGEYPYFCILHPNMVGSVSVG